MAQAQGTDEPAERRKLYLHRRRQNGRVCGYYAMATGGGFAPSRHKRRAPQHAGPAAGDGGSPDLAIDHHAHGIKLGGALLQDAVHRAVAVSQNAGVRALLVHALHDRAKAFYEHYGFQASPLQPMTLMLWLPAVKQ